MSTSPTRKTLTVFLPTLASGGAERVHINLAPAFIAAGFDVTFLVQRVEGSLSDAIPPEVRVITLNQPRTLACVFPLRRYMKQEQPDILISNMGHSNIVSVWARALCDETTRIIACHHSALSAEAAARDTWQFKILPLMCRLFLGWADGIVGVSKGVADDLAKTARLPRKRITTIYNPVILPDFDTRKDETVEHPWLQDGGAPAIVGVGRLTVQKDFATLIKAFAKATQSKDMRLILLGEGPLLEDLKSLAQSLGISERVSFAGFQPNPLPFIRQAKLLVMSSLYEGFGNVLVEALACGTPVVSTDCPHGPSEILDKGKFGKLVPVGAVDAMADAILKTLDKPLASETLATRGREFSLQRAADAYVSLMNRLTAGVTP